MTKAHFSLIGLAVTLSMISAPLMASAQGNATRGKLVFERSTCTLCHNGGGNTINPARPIKGAGFIKRHPNDTTIESIIRKGSGGTGMPAFPPSKISAGEMKDLIAYIRSLTPKKSK